MKLLGGILITTSLVAASISASVAYHVSVDRPEDEIVGLTLQDEQDLVWLVREHNSDSPAETQVIPDARKQLTPERIQMLRDRARKSAGRSAEYVRVREFDFSRWPAKWAFLLACLGMVAGALLQRRSARPSAPLAGETALTPKGALKAVAEKLDETVQLASSAAHDDVTRQKIVLAGADELQKGLVPAFVEAYPHMVAEMGMGRAAEIMDTFSEAERSINRAWSAACDGAGDEAMDCIMRAKRAIDEMTFAEIVDT